MNEHFMFVNERDPPSVAEQPAVRVNSWRVFEAENGDRHLLTILDDGPVRITSRIVDFDLAAAKLTTCSGRKYELLGLPETRQPQLSVLVANAQRSGLVGASDVSDALWQQIPRQ